MILYGAGKYCRQLLQKDVEKYSFEYIIDKNEEMHGTLLYGIPVVSLGEIKSLGVEIDKIVITTRLMVVSDVAETLRNTLHIDDSRLLFFRTETGEVLPYSELQREVVEKRALWAYAQEVIENGMLSEALDDGEFDGVNRLVVAGSDKEFRRVGCFLSDMSKRFDVMLLNKENYQWVPGDKVLICGDDYRDIIHYLKTRRVDESNWLILPLYDSKDSIM